MARNTIQRISNYIDKHFDEHLTTTQDYLRQPSISAQNLGIQKCAEMTRDILRGMGAQAHLVPLENGHPVVYGQLTSKSSDRTLLIYGMYDVQPVEPIEDWKSPPFEAAVVDDCVVARGALNSKGPLMAFINAVQSILSVTGDVPISMIFVIEGEEELGSPNLPQFIEKYVDELKVAEAMYYHTLSEWVKGCPQVCLGFKGIAYLELEVKVMSSDVHSMMAPVLRSPIWQLIWATNSMRGADGRITIDGFYENVQPPNSNDESLLMDLLEVYGPEAIRQKYGVTQFSTKLKELDFVRELIFAPTLNIDGFLAGYTDPGAKTIVPSSAMCKMDIRLVPNMTVQEMLGKVRKHLDKHGYRDISLRLVMGYNPSKTSMKQQVAQAAISAIQDLDAIPSVLPMMPGSAPQVLFSDPPLNLPVVASGLGHGGLLHAPNEYFEVEGLRACEKSAVAFLYEFANV